MHVRAGAGVRLLCSAVVWCVSYNYYNLLNINYNNSTLAPQLTTILLVVPPLLLLLNNDDLD